MSDSLHLPFEDLAPRQERPVLTCPCDEALTRDANELTRAFYKDEVVPIELYLTWLRKNPLLLVCLCDRLCQVQGYFDVFPVEPAFMDRFIAGHQTELDIREEHILAPGDAARCPRLYLGGIAVRDPQHFFQKRCASFLVWGFLKYILRYYGVEMEREIYALASTSEGEKLLRAFRFQIACGASKRLDGHNLYVYGLDRNSFKQLAANVPDWKDQCDVAFQGETPTGKPCGSELASRLLVFLFTDLVDSTGLKQRLGDVEYVRSVLQPHNAAFRALLERFPSAVERDNAGDGFFVTFESLADAIRFALLFQHRLETSAWELETPETRIGIHLGDSTEFQDAGPGQIKTAGQSQDLAARVMGLASGRQILLTRGVFDSARQYVRTHPAANEPTESDKVCGSLELQWLNHGAYLLKGKDEQVDVFEVGAVGYAPLQAPRNSEKARRVVVLEEGLAPDRRQCLGGTPSRPMKSAGPSLRLFEE